MELQPLSDQVLQQIGDAAAIPPFVVVPGYQLEEALVQLDSGAFVINRGGLGVDEIGADHFVIGGFKNAFEISVGRQL